MERTAPLLTVTFAATLLLCTATCAQNANPKTDAHLEKKREKLRAEVDAGNLTERDARARMVAVRVSLYLKRCEKGRTDAELKAAEARTWAAVAAEKATAEEAEAEVTARKESILAESRARTKTHVELFRSWEKCRADVATGKVTLREAEAKLGALKETLYADDRSYAAGIARLTAARLRLKQHLLAGDMTVDEVMSRMLAMEMALLAKACESAWLQAHLAEARAKLEVQVAEGNISIERAESEMESVLEEAYAKAEAADRRIDLAALIEPEPVVRQEDEPVAVARQGEGEPAPPAGQDGGEAAAPAGQGKGEPPPTDDTVWTAVVRGDLAAVRQYVAAGADINGTHLLPKTPGKGGTPLHVAISSRQIETAKLLIELGADVNARAANELSNVPLHWAAFAGLMDFVQVLVEAGANVNAGDKNGYTALDAALFHPGGAPKNREAKDAKDAVAMYLREKGGMRRDDRSSADMTVPSSCNRGLPGVPPPSSYSFPVLVPLLSAGVGERVMPASGRSRDEMDTAVLGRFGPAGFSDALFRRRTAGSMGLN